MRNVLFAAPIALALAACGSNETEEAASGAVADDAGASLETPAATPVASVAGTYVGTGEGGEQWSSLISEDGTYEDRVDGEVTETGTWTMRGERTCFVQDVGEGDPASPERCFSVGAPDAEGNVVITNSEGQELTIRKRMS